MRVTTILIMVTTVLGALWAKLRSIPVKIVGYTREDMEHSYRMNGLTTTDEESEWIAYTEYISERSCFDRLVDMDEFLMNYRYAGGYCG